MKPEELQIYDWVLINDTPHQVKQITQKKVGYHRIPYNLDYARLVDVKPIPITAEILEMNGFKFSGKNCNMWVLAIGADWSIGVGLWEDMGTLIKCVKQEPKGAKVVHLSYTPYVHQLQQAIRLCGINKRIKL